MSDPRAVTQDVATFGGGCFWCTEAVFEQLQGVESVVSGYAGGHVVNPTYEQVCAKTTGHAEVVQITFDPSVISYRELVEIFLATHDPTTLNRQGNDAGPQYRSAIYYHNNAQKTVAKAVIQEWTTAKYFPDPIVTEVTALTTFYAAEQYHQGYYRGNSYQPYCAFVVTPKVAKFRKQYANKVRSEPL